MTYLFIYNLKNQNRIDFLQEQINILKSNLDKQKDEIAFLKTSSEAKIAYNILKDNCRKMGTCHLFK
jgi:hypothetical protein